MYNQLLENIAKNIKKSLIKEGIFDDNDFDRYHDVEDDYEEEINPFDEYKNGYPDDPDFNPNEITRRDLIKFCHSFGDFFIIVEDLFRGGMRLYVASTEEQQMAIIADICKGEVTLTHEMDYLIDNKLNFENDYIAVFKIQPINDTVFYLVYEQSKYPRYDESKNRKKTIKLSKSDLNKMISESIQKMIK